MSASNWAVCPRCFARAKKDHAEIAQVAATAYGVVPLDEFDALRIRVDQGVDEEDYRTFREDYEIYGAEDGTITASYGGGCDKCGLTVSFKHEVPFFSPEELS